MNSWEKKKWEEWKEAKKKTREKCLVLFRKKDAQGLVEMLFEPGGGYYAPDYLIQLGKRAVEPLIEFLKKNDLLYGAFRDALYALGQVDEEGQAVNLLTDLLRKEKTFSIKAESVISALGEIAKRTKNARAIGVLANPPSSLEEVKKAGQLQLATIGLDDQIKSNLQRYGALQELADLGGL